MEKDQFNSDYQDKYNNSIQNPEKFWEENALENLHFFKKWETVYGFENYHPKWFDGALLNVSYNCLDRHLTESTQNKTALIWEGEDGQTHHFTYKELHKSVCQFAHVLESYGTQTGDCVVIYMPLIPEAVIAMLACTRIGATHTVVFGGFSAESLSDRINDCQAKLLITADYGYRKGTLLELKSTADTACLTSPSIKHCIVACRLKDNKKPAPMQKDRDVFWDEEIAKQSEVHSAKPLPAEHPLFMLYTSGTTGKPKGLVHTTAGYLLGAHMSTKWIFDLQKSDILWTTADIGWITGHTYAVYGPLSNGGTVFMYEGAPFYPDSGRFWNMIEKYKITILYTAPTAIRMFVKFGREWPDKYDLSSLRLLGTVGEPISPETWNWYHEVIGHKKCPIVDTWWQTETGSVLIVPLTQHMSTKPGSAGRPIFGIEPVILNEEGQEVQKDEKGFLCIKKPWPSIARTIYKNHDRYVDGYWKHFEGVYFTGDGAQYDEDGYFWVTGRIDDVLNVSGHRLSTTELENAILSHQSVAECAVVGINHSIKGQSPVAFIMLKSGNEQSDNFKHELQKNIEQHIGTFARAEKIYFVPAFPKTRSGKMMRRLLREFAQTGELTGDMTTLEDTSVLEIFKNIS